ncbi:GNAT family N-acetyltransferase [Nitrosospira multiformis]|uniref:Acetyltransferase (GNAT) domain-containing protein n=1 Tax=Nitrosospira multiformis TaxID=1231 RepID=A0A1I7IMU1_9PROT|nr:GNAT family N-acetyltransferase [Nitrosospira multiformis]SFU74250.1 Acetyltransferase (GNAT) domain-containing protein [Nitrosospira multiformis]
MNQTWHCQQVPIKIQLGDKTFLAPRLWLQVREAGLDDEAPSVAEPIAPADPLPAESQGFLIRSLRVIGHQPVFRRQGVYLCYVPAQYPRYYIDMQQSFSEYKSKFSSKTRSTLSRKIRKYTEHCGGSISWRVYRSPGEMAEFFRLARTVSRTTYQERLLDAGLPDSEEFCEEMEQLAQQDCVRAFLLFHQDRPVSYLYCPISNGVVLYAYLGYDPDYMNFSVGTVLQWFALEYLFEEKIFRFFDFTEGQSEHKKLFATGSVQCANVFFVRDTLHNMCLLQIQRAVDSLSKFTGDRLERLGIKASLKRLIRSGR